MSETLIDCIRRIRERESKDVDIIESIDHILEAIKEETCDDRPTNN